VLFLIGIIIHTSFIGVEMQILLIIWVSLPVTDILFHYKYWFEIIFEPEGPHFFKTRVTIIK